jgi:metal-responsive CopG/Arc/MetJ family transcriptional regulator
VAFSTQTSTTFTYIEPEFTIVRPEIPEELEALIDKVASDNGFSSKSEFVRHATREYALNLKDE